MPLIKNKLRIPKPPSFVSLEQHYAVSIILLLEPLKGLIESELFPVLPKVFKEDSIRNDDTDLIKEAFNRIRDRYKKIVSDRKINKTIEDTAKRVNSKNKDHHNKTMETVLGVNPIQAEPWLKPAVNTFVNENASLIKTIPNESLSDIEQMVYRDSSRGLSPQEMKEKIKEEFDLSEGRAKVIARDQISKFNGALTKERQINAGIEEYIWRDGDDGRVRPDHHRLNGKKYSWDDPPVTVTTGKRAGERNHPGQDIVCRCYAEPDLSDLL